MRKQIQSYHFALLVCLVLLVSTAGCEENLTAVELSDNAFSMYGIINPLQPVQAVRIYQIDEVLSPIKPEPIDAIVKSTDLNTSETVAWRDSVVSFPDGKFGHVFYAPLTPQHGHRYKLEVQKPGGPAASATTTVPPVSVGEVLPHTVSGFFVVQPVLWHDAPNLINIRVRYFTNVGLYEVDYNVSQEDVTGGRQVSIQMHEDTKIIFQSAVFFGVRNVELVKMDMRLVITDKDWTPPGGVFDADVFSVPGTFTNVTDGFGFVGAGYPTALEWEPSNELRRELGFVEQ